MEPQEKLTTQQFVIDRLQDIHRKAEANNFSDALATIKEVKAADAKNIYLIAIEKQIAKLSDTSLPAESRTSIIKSLPAMIDRAISDIQRRAAAAPAPKADESQKEQKEAALEKLKSQYFQRADDYVEKHEFQRALEEIRRIYIIEPGSVVAKEYEQKIEQLAALHVRSEAHAAAAAETKEQKTEVQKPKPPEVKESKTAVPPVEAPKEKVAEKAQEEPKKSKLPMMIAAAAIVVLALVAWFVFGKKSGSTPPSQDQAQQSQPAQQPVAVPEPVNTTTTPQTGKTTAPANETTKQSAKAEKKQSETKSASQAQKTVQPPVIPPAKTQAVTQPKATQQQTKQLASQTTAANTQQPAQQPSVSESAPAPMPFVAIENPPEIIRREPAKYPDLAIKMGMQGKVVVEVTVDAQGKPIQTKILQSTSDVFNDAATEAVMKYTYKPAMQSNGPVTAKIVIPIKFNLQK